ncbi:putative complex I protein [Sodiomyces alkalinus F11]|uniref:Putative complex I protein n=1 Tax=Sodiomyces alkalinus (strain CBS 110278 / VKM F-3762 / F11) TaxID=1314773 RepID=A0A3N2Q4J6_SODAK|nr:putative complex I protein [Sodiomyces alkalinus F11]ROT41703.1 putative complex I protein [Sodiomyces alkalinus F11]
MRPTEALRKGFLGRSMDEFKRLAVVAFRAEGVKGPSGPLLLQDFRDPESISQCKTMTDQEIGGFSHCALDWASSQDSADPSALSPTSAQPPGHARFHGTISTELPKNKPDIQRTGYAAWRTLDRPPTVFGKSLWDIDMYAYLAMRVRSDGRSYFINLQTESVVPTDLHQHRLFAKRPGEWETVLVKWNDFVRTNHGFVVEPQTELLRRKIRTVGVGLTDRVPGPFELCIERIWATNDVAEADSVMDAGEAGQTASELRDRQGKSILWKEA